MIQKIKETCYLKEHLELLDERLLITKELENKDKSLSFLITLIIIDGLPKIK